ncbi:hypothetical protein BTVI_61046 [Pitangus sulphuratus]|nr:hypothetical protein BTVI_61046 [Pitangus sulphuratus]
MKSSSPWLGFANEDLRRALPTLAASVLMAKKANARQTSPIAEGTAERLPRWYRQAMTLSALSFLLESDPACVLKGSSIMDGVSPGLPTGSQSRLMVMISIAKAEIHRTKMQASRASF